MVEKIAVKVMYKNNGTEPTYTTIGAAGCDLVANITEPYTLKPMERKLFPTGVYFQLPEGVEAQVRPRSGLALKHGISVINTPGTVDADYIGEVGVVLINLSAEPFTINPGDRIAQVVFNRYVVADFQQVDELVKTERGEGGFGHTGMN